MYLDLKGVELNLNSINSGFILTRLRDSSRDRYYYHDPAELLVT